MKRLYVKSINRVWQTIKTFFYEKQASQSSANPAFPYLKELEHKQLGWKVLIQKYDLGKSLSKEIWCKMADTNKNLDNIFKNTRNACNVR